ncbi:MAG: DODA-type extradiol aromatic ring-opening family dioxygenase [Gammaproteobacteria bacterium]
MRTGHILFISHGSPSYGIETNPAVRFWEVLGRKMAPRLEAAIVISAHAQGQATLRGGGRQSKLLCDFSGFPAACDRKTWTPPVGYEQHAEIVRALQSVGLRVDSDPEGPLDHGVWVPLEAMWPTPTFPVFSLVLPEDSDLDHWWQMGERLAPLLDRPYLWIGSGGIVHNLMRLDWGRRFGPGEAWAETFADWVTDALSRVDRAQITHPASGPGGAWAVPTSEHYAPLVLVAALAQPRHLVPLYHGFDYGNLALHVFGEAPPYVARPDHSFIPLETAPHAQQI